MADNKKLRNFQTTYAGEDSKPKSACFCMQSAHPRKKEGNKPA
jgi:hypothetical protein